MSEYYKGGGGRYGREEFSEEEVWGVVGGGRSNEQQEFMGSGSKKSQTKQKQLQKQKQKKEEEEEEEEGEEEEEEEEEGDGEGSYGYCCNYKRSEQSSTEARSAPMDVPYAFQRGSESCGLCTDDMVGSLHLGDGYGYAHAHAHAYGHGHGDDGHGYDGHGHGTTTPPHLMSYTVRQPSSSVTEGAGRTLKGRDLRDVRNTVWKRTGFL